MCLNLFYSKIKKQLLHLKVKLQNMYNVGCYKLKLHYQAKPSSKVKDIKMNASNKLLNVYWQVNNCKL